mmetsp:Transcript_64705/g.163874  ORF Transcript_64705/g.163874 Transcript_64705/m.163874 type:complete len:225 (+) Transcript_64705:2-676(+)
MDDDAMVNNVLGAVAELKAGKGASTNLRGPGGVDSESDALQWKDNTAVSIAPVAAAAPTIPVGVGSKPQAAMSQQNSYLKEFDFGFETQSARSRHSDAGQENTYLKGMSLGSDPATSAAAMVAPTMEAPAEAAARAEPARVAQLGLHATAAKANSNDYLTSFHWDDEAPAQTAPPAAAATKASGSGSNALLAWLDGSPPAAVATAPKAATAPSFQQSSYMMDLQ